MYVPGEKGVMERFYVGPTPTALGLAIFVLGYGIGPLIFAPIYEIPAVGTNWVFIPTFLLFVILCIPTAVVDDYAGLLVLRFLTGFFGSPCLANGGTTVGDMVSHDPNGSNLLSLTTQSSLFLNFPSISSRGQRLVFGVPRLDHWLPVSQSRPNDGVGDSGR
jgi:MFS family permease